MTQPSSTSEQKAGRTAALPEDLSEAISLSMERRPNEEVKSVWLFGDRYRCNWWVRDRGSHWLASATGLITRSKFLRVTKVADKLVIQDLSNR